MTITLTPEIEIALQQAAAEKNIAPEQLALDSLRASLVPHAQRRYTTASAATEPRDDWEHMLFGIGIDASVSLTNDQTGREVIYEDQG